jgi:4'-phosphopantetheinyl transferase EntD
MAYDVTDVCKARAPLRRGAGIPDNRYCRVSGLFDDPRVHVLTCAISESAIDLLSARETAAMAGFAQKRRREFATGRALAREGLGRVFDVRGFDLLNAADRAPIWPAGISGSIAHSDSHAWVALADAGYGSIGIDGEARTELKRELWHLTLREEEVAYLETLPEAIRGRRALALFCAKEALYKAQYPRTGSFMEYHALRVELGPAGALRCTFRRVVGSFPQGYAAAGRWLDEPQLVAAVWIPAG